MNAEILKKKKLKSRKRELFVEYGARALYWAEQYHINSRGERMDFRQMPYLLSLYMEIGEEKKLCIEKAVQTGISEMGIIESHREAAEMGLSVMYVLPKYESRNRFVNNRIYKLHRRAEHYRHQLKEVAAAIHRTSLIHFGRGTIAFVGSNVESEFIEMPIDSAYVDEKDRCNKDNLLLLPDRYSASPYRFHREFSNPTVEGYGIDARFQESSQGLWHIKCPKCGSWFHPDFFKHVVQEVGPKQYKPRDQEWERGKDMRLVHDCGAYVNRLDGKNAEWVDMYKGREWTGRRISRVYCKTTSVESMYLEWLEAQGNDRKIQVFYNSYLGLPFTSEGARINRYDLEACQRSYEWPMDPGKASRTRIMGVDVGKVLNVIIRDVVNEGSEQKRRLVLACTVPGFQALSDLIYHWNPSSVVVDANPEIHKVMELKEKHKNVYSSRFQQDLQKISVNKTTREVNMDRTALLDYVKQSIVQQSIILPKEAEFVDNGSYYDQMMSSTRVLDVNEENPERSRFIWVHSKDDHYLLAEAYCFQAGLLVPNLSVFEFFETETARMEGLAPKVGGVVTMTEEQRKEFDRLQGIDAQMFLHNIQNKYAGRKVDE